MAGEYIQIDDSIIEIRMNDIILGIQNHYWKANGRILAPVSLNMLKRRH